MSDDSFGEMLIDQLNSEKDIFYVIERDDALIDVMSGKFYFGTFNKWSKLEQKIISFAKGTTLDLACGAGRHRLYLQNKGFETYPVDISEGAITVCLNQGLDNAKVLSILNLNKLPSDIDTVLIMGNSLPVYGGEIGLENALSHFYTITPKLGKVILNIRIYDLSATIPDYHIEYREKNKKEGNPEGFLRFRVRYHKMISEWLDFFTPTQAIYNDIIQKTRWNIAFQEKEGSILYQVLTK